MPGTLRRNVDPNVSDRNLRAFVEAARFGSLTRAAQHLGLGQPAVSHAISRLETGMGVRLLERSRSGVRPTAIGAELLDTVDHAYRSVDAAVRWAMTPQNDGDVGISVSTSLASWWLLPRLPEFKRMHPDVSLRLVTADADESVDPDTVDLWIPLGPVNRPQLVSTSLCEEALVPVTSPELAADLGRPSPEALLRAPLLHLEERYAPRFDWIRWFAHHDVAAAGRLPGDRSNDYSLVLQAALDGQGVALGWMHIVADLIDEGRLVGLAAPVVTEQPFTILHHASRPLSPGAAALRQWLVDAMAN